MTHPRSELTDPRRYGGTVPHHRYYGLPAGDLHLALTDALASGFDADISAALKAAPSRMAYAGLWETVCDVAHHTAGVSESAVVARIFALPLIIVTGSRRPASLPGVVPDIAEVRSVLEQNGALGRTRNFGIGNALISYDTLAQVKSSEIFVWTDAAGGGQRELAPCPIEVPEPGEHVHLRFLVGACITPAADSSFIEAASNIGAWGMPLTRALAAQFAQSGVDVLPMARPPQDLLRAGHTGRAAQLEAAFNLFVSNGLRRFRRVSGDPVTVVSAHDDGDIRVSFSSPFDDTMVEGFRWPLDLVDDLDAVTAEIAGLLAGCRLTDVRYVPGVRPALNALGHVWFLTVRDVEFACDTISSH